jgi:hypothetical protein
MQDIIKTFLGHIPDKIRTRVGQVFVEPNPKISEQSDGFAAVNPEKIGGSQHLGFIQGGVLELDPVASDDRYS